MPRVARNVPMTVLVQLFFTRGQTPGLRALARRIRAGQTRAWLTILPTGGTFELPGAGTLRASYDILTDERGAEVLTLALDPDPLSPAASEPEWLDRQSRLLQSIIADLGAVETHWHLLPGRIDRAAERRLARRAIALLRRPVHAVLPAGARSAARLPGPDAPPSRGTRTDEALPVVANDLPALPRPRHDRHRAVLDALTRIARPSGADRITLRLGSGPILRMGLPAAT